MSKIGKIIRKVGGKEELRGLYFFCPGCKMGHQFNTQEKMLWQFNNDFENPTLSPSYLRYWDEGEEGVKYRCHSFIKDGMIQFLGDCTHDLKNQTVPLPDIDSKD